MKELYEQKLEELASKIPWSEVPDEIEPSPQPEEWESRFDQFYALPQGMEAGPQREKAIKNFIKSEIRKAEERKLQEILNALLKEARRTDYADRTEYDVVYDFIKDLEAIKK